MQAVRPPKYKVALNILNEIYPEAVDIARRVGVTPSTVQRWLGGAKPQETHREAIIRLAEEEVRSPLYTAQAELVLSEDQK